MRVLQVTARYFPLTGGIETHVYEVARRLATRGVDTTVLTTTVDARQVGTERVEGVTIRRIRAWPAERDYYFAPGIAALIRRGEWDVIHCQGISTAVAPLTMASALRARTPFVLTFHTGGHPSPLRRKLQPVQWRVQRSLLTRASRLIGVSRFEADLFGRVLGLPPSRFLVVSNGSQLPRVPAVPAPDPAAPLILSVGRLERYKGHHRVLAAFPLILRHYPEARLQILGSGPYEAELRRRIDLLDLAGRVQIRAIPAGAREEMAATLARASVVALLSEYEANPIAVMEALSLHRPVVVADTSGLRELAAQGLARAVPLNSPPADVAAALLAELGRTSAPAAVEVPSWDDCTDRLLSIYRGVASA